MSSVVTIKEDEVRQTLLRLRVELDRRLASPINMKHWQPNREDADVVRDAERYFPWLIQEILADYEIKYSAAPFCIVHKSAL